MKVNKFNENSNLEPKFGYYKIPYNKIVYIKAAFEKLINFGFSRKFIIWLQHSFEVYWSNFGDYENSVEFLDIIVSIENQEMINTSWSFFRIEKSFSNKKIKSRIKRYYKDQQYCGELKLEDWELGAIKYNL